METTKMNDKSEVSTKDLTNVGGIVKVLVRGLAVFSGVWLALTIHANYPVTLKKKA